MCDFMFCFCVNHLLQKGSHIKKRHSKGKFDPFFGDKLAIQYTTVIMFMMIILCMNDFVMALYWLLCDSNKFIKIKGFSHSSILKIVTKTEYHKTRVGPMVL